MKKPLTVYAVAFAVRCEETIHHEKMEMLHEEVREMLLTALNAAQQAIKDRFPTIELAFTITE